MARPTGWLVSMMMAAAVMVVMPACLGDLPEAEQCPSPAAREGKALGTGRYLIARVVRAKDSPWHGGKSYVDLLKPGVTEKFLEITLGFFKIAL